MPAANAAECAREQGKFWEMHDLLFENNKALEDADIEGYADKIGLNTKAFKACFGENKHKSRIERDQRTAVSLGARGTPAFFVNGRYISGAQPFENFKKLIDEELKKAQASKMRGNEYYEKMIVEKGKKKL